MEANKIIDNLIAAQEKIGSLIDTLAALKNNAASFGGEIARVIPTNIQADIDALMDIYEGEGQYSLTSLIDFMDNIPLGELRQKSVVKTEIDVAGRAAEQPVARPAAPRINTQPTEGPAQSAIATNESVSLSDFYQDRFREQAHAYRNFSFDSIKESFEGKAAELGANPITGIESIFNNSRSLVNSNANRYSESVTNGPELELSDWKQLTEGNDLSLTKML